MTIDQWVKKVLNKHTGRADSEQWAITHVYTSDEFIKWLASNDLASFFADNQNECAQALLQSKDKVVRCVEINNLIVFCKP